MHPQPHRGAVRLKTALLALLAALVAGALASLGALVWDIWSFLANPPLPEAAYGLENAAGAAPPGNGEALGQVSRRTWVELFWWGVLAWGLAKCYRIVAAETWGRDCTWSRGGWVDSGAGLRPCPGPGDCAPLVRAVGRYKAGLVGAGIICMLVAAGGLRAALELANEFSRDGRVSPFTATGLLAALAFLGVVVYATALAFTRRLRFDASGIRDENFFQTERVAWADVATLRLADVASGPPGDSSGPADVPHEAWVLADHRGRTILTLDRDMTPAESLAALRACHAAHAAIVPPGDDFAPADDNAGYPGVPATVRSRGFRRMLVNHARRMHDFERQFTRSTRIGAAAVLLLLVLPTAVTTYRALWFSVAATRTQGVVVDVSREEASSLTVEYRAGAAKPLRIRTDNGSAGYARFTAGSTVGVLYDPDHPERARLDLFKELWLGPLVLGGVTLVATAIMALVVRAGRQRRN